MKIAICCVAAVFLFAPCNQKKKEQGTTNEEKTEKKDKVLTVPADDGGGEKGEESGDKTVYNLVVSFESESAGIDQQAKKDYDEFIASFEKGNNVKLNYQQANWGQEGERDYCFDLANLKDEQTKLFITRTREVLGKSAITSVHENKSCRNRK